ncbi:MFS transporter [Paenibacillus sp. GCM10027626]|uniref:MFS transporter n=1 Tax=Paenibacillus sp. GCM10027626 TaxID=3273411 RepID=UPI003624FB0D
MGVWSDFKRFVRIKRAGVLLLTLFCYGIGTGILAPMNSIYLSESIGLSKGQVVSVFAISLILNMIATMTVGMISDRLRSKRKLAISAALLCILGLIFYMRAESYTSALFGMCLAVAPSGLIMGQLFAMSRNHFMQLAPDIVEMAQIWLRASLSVGFFAGLLIGANLYLLATFQGVLWGNMAGYALLVVLLLGYKEYSSAIAEGSNGGSAPNSEPFSLIMLIALFMIACADAIRGLYLPLVVKDLFGKAELMSYIWSIQAVFELLFMTIAGYWAAKYGSKRIILIGSAAALITYTVYASSASLIVFFLVQPVYSFFVSILYGVAMGYVQRMFAGRSGFGSSLYVFISLAASLAGYMFPLLIAGYDPRIFIIPLSLTAASMIIMLIVLSRDRKLASSSMHISS